MESGFCSVHRLRFRYLLSIALELDMSPVAVVRWLLVASAVWRMRFALGSSFYYESLRCAHYLSSETFKVQLRPGNIEIHIRNNLKVRYSETITYIWMLITGFVRRSLFVFALL